MLVRTDLLAPLSRGFLSWVLVWRWSSTERLKVTATDARGRMPAQHGLAGEASPQPVRDSDLALELRLDQPAGQLNGYPAPELRVILGDVRELLRGYLRSDDRVFRLDGG